MALVDQSIWLRWLLSNVTSRSPGVVFKDIVLYIMFVVESTTLSLMMMQFALLVLHTVNAVKLINRRLEIILLNLESKKLILAEEVNVSTPLYDNIKIPLSSINRTIDMLGNINQIVIADPSGNHNNTENMRLLVKTFDSICEALRKLNRYFDIEILIETLLYAFSIWRVFNVFVEVMYFATDTPKYIEFIKFISWGVYYLLQLYTLIEPFYQIGIEVEQTRFLLSQMMTKVDSSDDLLWVEVNKFNTLLSYQNFSHAAANICNLDRALVLKIISAVVTFSVTLLDLTK
ncbi:uncharacterized protein LOC121728138 [Aricia agestis]|uniref:uncharacterized protein LOC121728138 n=1 Tax=Aricia agestis TaxID=91739 RepID=UPI001C206B7D|nr:uncharacterized protein LOC121728138 [Aricia agestis]